MGSWLTIVIIGEIEHIVRGVYGFEYGFEIMFVVRVVMVLVNAEIGLDGVRRVRGDVELPL